MIFPPCDNSTIIVQPGNTALHNPTSFEAWELSTILRRWFDSRLTMRADQIDLIFHQPFAQWVRVGGFVINQSLGLSILQCVFCKQRLDQLDFATAGRFCVDRHRCPATIDEDHDFSAFATTSRANSSTPFFAEANVPSAKVSEKSIWPASSIRSKMICQADKSRPSIVHCWKRRWHVALEGYSFGKSFHRAPVTRIQRMPSRQSRGWALGRPPFLEGGVQGNKFATKDPLFIGQNDRAFRPGRCFCGNPFSFGPPDQRHIHEKFSIQENITCKHHAKQFTFFDVMRQLCSV